MGIAELACVLSSAVEAVESDAQSVTKLLLQLCSLLESPEAATELDEILLDLHVTLMHATEQSPAAEAAVRQLLAFAAAQCTAREVFTLCMATLAQELSELHGEGSPLAASSAHGPASPAFQMFLMGTLLRCLPRIRRRPLHFLAEALHMQLRWAAEALPSLPLGSVAAADAAMPASETGPASDGATSEPPALREGALTAASAVAYLSSLAVQAAGWVRQLGDEEGQPGSQLLSTILLQLASIAAQLPQQLEAAAAALHPQATAGARAVTPTPGSRLPLMRAAAGAALGLPCALLRSMPACLGQGIDAAALWQLAEDAPRQLARCGLEPGELPFFSPAEATEGAALAACAAALALGPQPTPPTPRQLHASLLGVLPRAACILLDAGAAHRSAALTLLPLCALCTAGHSLANAPTDRSQQDARLYVSSADLDALLAALVTLMSHNPVQLLRSCAHDALHAVLEAFQPRARLAQLRALMQLPSTAASVVALQRLRQEMAAAWDAAPKALQQAQQAGLDAAAACADAEPPALAVCPWLSAEALALALPCLHHGPPGWHDERDVLEAADVQGAALSLLRWVLLREAAAPRGLLPRGDAQRLLQRDLLPLRAAVLRLLDGQAAGGIAVDSGESLPEQQLLHSFMAVQRLHDALACVIDLIPQAPAGGCS